MKIYTISRGTGGQVGCAVSEHHYQNGNVRPFPFVVLLEHIAYHSPSGFETGYSGSGPADLALSILADHFGVTRAELLDETSWKRAFWNFRENDRARSAWALHQDFKFQFIAPRQIAPGKHYEILGAEIAAWIDGLEEPSAETLRADAALPSP